VEIVLDRRGLLTKTFDSLPKAPSCALTLEGMVLGGMGERPLEDLVV
jgi:hypothetical protein